MIAWKVVSFHGVRSTVAGRKFNGNMPAFGKKLSNEKLAAVLTFIRQAWDNSAGPIDAASVAKTRTATETQSNPWKAEQLLQIEAADD